MLSNQARQNVNQANYPHKTQVHVKARKSISDPSVSLGSGAESDEQSNFFDEPQRSSRPRAFLLEPSTQRDGIQGRGRTYQRLWSRGHDTSILESSHQNIQRTKYYYASRTRDPSPELIEILEPRELLFTAGGSRLRQHSSARLRPDAGGDTSLVEFFRPDFKLRPAKSFTEAGSSSTSLIKRIPNRILVNGPFAPKTRGDLRGERGRTPVPTDSNCCLQKFYEQVEAERHHNPITTYKLTKQPSFLSARSSESHFVHPAHSRRAGSLLNSVSCESGPRTILLKDSQSDFQIHACQPVPNLFRETPSEVSQASLVSGRRSSRIGLPPLPPNAATKVKKSLIEVGTSEDSLLPNNNSRLLTATLSIGDTSVRSEHSDLQKYKPSISYSTPSCLHQVSRVPSRSGSRQGSLPRSRVHETESCTDLHAKYHSVSDPCVKCPICIERCGRTRVHYQSMQSRYMTDLEWRICHAVNIYVYQNGVENRAPQLVHVPPAKKKSMKHVMGLIHDRLKFPIGFAKTLYKMDGTRIRHPCELEMYNNYVASNNYDKHFKCCQYGRKRSPLLILNRESKHIRQLRLQNDQYDQFLIKKAAAGDERPQYVYPTLYTSDGYGPADLPVGTGGNYQPCGPVCKLPKKKCYDGNRVRCEDDGMGDASGAPSTYGSYAGNPSNQSSQATHNRVKFENNAIVGNVTVPPLKLKSSVEMLPKKKSVPDSTQEEDVKNNNDPNNNVVVANESTTTTNNPETYKNVGDEEDAVFFQKKRSSHGVIDSTGKTKPVFRSSDTNANRPPPAKCDEIPEACEQSLEEEPTDTEIEDESEYDPMISAPSPSYTVVKPRNRTETLQARRTQTLEDDSMSGMSGTTIDAGASNQVPVQRQRKPSKIHIPQQQQQNVKPQYVQQPAQQPQQKAQRVRQRAQRTQQQAQQQQAQYVQQQVQQEPQYVQQLPQVQPQYLSMPDQQNVAYQQTQQVPRYVQQEQQQPLRMGQPQLQSLRLPPGQQQSVRIVQHQQQGMRIPNQAMKFAQQLQQSRMEQQIQPSAQMSQRFYQQDLQPTQVFIQQQEQQQPQGYLAQSQDQQQTQGYAQRTGQPLEGPTYFEQVPVQQQQNLPWISAQQAPQLSQYTVPSFQDQQPQQQQVYNVSLVEQSQGNRPLPPHMMLNTGFSTGFIPSVRMSRSRDQRILPQSPSQIEEVDIPYTPLDGATRPPPTLLQRSSFGSSAALNQQFCFNPRLPVKEAISKRNVAIQMGIPDPEMIHAGSCSQFNTMTLENKQPTTVRPLEFLGHSFQNQTRMHRAVLEQEKVAHVMGSSSVTNNNAKSSGTSVVYQPVYVPDPQHQQQQFNLSPQHQQQLNLSPQHQQQQFNLSPQHQQQFNLSPQHQQQLNLSPQRQQQLNLSPQHQQNQQIHSLQQQPLPIDQNYYSTTMPPDCLPPPSRFADSTTNTSHNYQNNANSNEPRGTQDRRHAHAHHQQQHHVQQKSSRAQLHQNNQSSSSRTNCPDPRQPPHFRYEDYMHVGGQKVPSVTSTKKTGR